MQLTISASFADTAGANVAIGALVAAGFRREDITVASKDAQLPGSESGQEFGAMTGAFPDLAPGGQGSLVGDDASYGMRYSGIAATANATVDPGNMTDYLWESLPSDVASDCRKELSAGRTIVIVQNATERTVEILEANGATKVLDGKASRP